MEINFRLFIRGATWLEADPQNVLALPYLRHNFDERVIAYHRKLFIDNPDFYQIIAYSHSYPQIPDTNYFESLVPIEAVAHPKNLNQIFLNWRRLVGMRFRVARRRPHDENSEIPFITVKEISEATGMSESVIHLFSFGDSSFSSKDVGFKVARLLRVDFQWLLGYDYLQRYLTPDEFERNFDSVSKHTTFAETAGAALNVDISTIDPSFSPKQKFGQYQPADMSAHLRYAEINESHLSWLRLVGTRLKESLGQKRLVDGRVVTLTIAEVSRQLKIPTSWVFRLTQGESGRLSLLRGRRIAEVLGVPVHYLLAFDLLRDTFSKYTSEDLAPFLGIQPEFKSILEHANQPFNEAMTETGESPQLDLTSEYDALKIEAFDSPTMVGGILRTWAMIVRARFNFEVSRPRYLNGTIVIWNQSIVAEKLGTYAMLISQISRGVKSFRSLQFAKDAADLFEVSLEWLMAYDYLRARLDKNEYVDHVKTTREKSDVHRFVKDALKIEDVNDADLHSSAQAIANHGLSRCENLFTVNE